MRRIGLSLASIAVVGAVGSAFGAGPVVGTPVEIEGAIYEAADISAVVAIDGFLVIASDEESSVQVLEEVERGKSYRALAPVNLAGEAIALTTKGDEIELDLEGLAVDGRTVYAIGSHSRKRSKVTITDEDRTYVKNRKRLAKTHPEDNRNWLFRMLLDETGGIDANAVTRTTLRNAILREPTLDLFWTIPGKENGIDIEAITSLDETLYAGFRSPILRGKWVPILVLKQGDPPLTHIRFVNLGGLGVRGMETVEDGLLLLAGPAGEASEEARVYLWNGEDMLPGTAGPDARLTCLATIAPFPGGTAEGLARIETSEASWDVLIAFDGVEDNGRILGRFQIPRRPGPAACDAGNPGGAREHTEMIRKNGMTEAALEDLDVVASLRTGETRLLFTEGEEAGAYVRSYAGTSCDLPGTDHGRVAQLQAALRKTTLEDREALQSYVDADRSGFVSTAEASEFRDLIEFGHLAAFVIEEKGPYLDRIATAAALSPEATAAKLARYNRVAERLNAGTRHPMAVIRLNEDG